MRRAAVAVLARDGAAGPEVLLLRRAASSRTFASAWVFPGGVVEAADGPADEPGSWQRAAARECAEEAGLDVAATALRPWSVWIPPADGPAPYRTSYFVTRAPRQQPRVDGDEVVDLLWTAPATALALQARGELTLFPPTWLTLGELAGFGTVDALLDGAPSCPPVHRAAVQRSPGHSLFAWRYGDQVLDTARLPWRLRPAVPS